MIRIGENLNVMVKKIGAAMKEGIPNPSRSWRSPRPRRASIISISIWGRPAKRAPN